VGEAPCFSWAVVSVTMLRLLRIFSRTHCCWSTAAKTCVPSGPRRWRHVVIVEASSNWHGVPGVACANTWPTSMPHKAIQYRFSCRPCTTRASERCKRGLSTCRPTIKRRGWHTGPSGGNTGAARR
jgi:hypothetical protein